MSNEFKVESVFRDVIFTILTFGIWNMWVQYRQIHDMNYTLERLGHKTRIPSFWKIIFLSVITLGIYFCYHEFHLTRELHRINYSKTFFFFEFFLSLLTFLGLWFFVDSYQQTLLNRIVEKNLLEKEVLA